MSGLFFLAMLCGITWLAIWAALPRPWQGGGWWPFDMRETGAKTEAEPTRRRAHAVPRRERSPMRKRR